MSEKEIEVLSPFGPIHIPKPTIPKLKPLEMDERRGKAMGHAVAIDLASIIAIIPIAGDIVGDVVSDTHFSELYKLLTPAERKEFDIQDRVAPAMIALARAYMHE